MQMTWPGAPTLYYGDEAGVCGFTDPDSRRTYPWGKENRELMEFYRETIRIHRNNPVLKRGSLLLLNTEPGLLAYGRFWGEEQMIVVVNQSDELREVVVPVWRAEVAENAHMARLLYTYEDGYTEELEEYKVQHGEIAMMMGKSSAVVLKNKKW